jgi:hypothetical protein
MRGTLQVSNGAVTGTIIPHSDGLSYLNSNICPVVTQPISVTGTLDEAHDLVLTFPIAGGTATLLATLADDPATYANGSWTVNGGTCAMSMTPMVIQQTAPTTPPPAPASPAPITANLSGNWEADITYNPNYFVTYFSNFGPSIGYTPLVTGFGGSLQFSNGAVTGTLTSYINQEASCYGQYIVDNTATVAVTGTLDASNNLTLTVPVARGTATITATLGSNPQTLADGSFQIVGGDCPMSATPMTIAQYAPVTGTYTGTFNEAYSGDNVPFSGTDITVTAVLTQSTTANSSGIFPLTGTLNVTGACTGSIPLPSGTVQGSNVWSSNVGAGLGLIFSSDPTASTLTSTFYDVGTNFSGPCRSGYQGTLVRQ